MRRGLGLLTCGLVLGCSAFAPSTSEDDGVGSNTNWFRACDTDGECGADLGCICGTCTKACSTDSDCGVDAGGICPLDLGAYAAACGPQATLDAQAPTCFQGCSENSDCPGARICIAGACAEVDPDACEDAASVELISSSPQLRARIGGLFGDQYYLPQWFAAYPGGWEEPYEPSVLTARVLDDAGAPVGGCRVELLSEESSGAAFSEDPITDNNGEVSALWVAGSAPQQTLMAAVRADGQWLTAEIQGEARGHNEAPQASGPEAADYTPPTGLIVSPAVSEAASQVRIGFTPLTFPPRLTYVVMDTDIFSIQYTNGGLVDPVDGEVPASDRLLTLRVFDQAGESGEVIAILDSGFCTQDTPGFHCDFPDAWLPGEALEARIDARQVAYGEAPAEYDPATHADSPCLSPLGCTDYSVFTRRAGGQAQRQAVLRGPSLDQFSNRMIYIAGVYTPEVGIASNCLETKRAAFVASHELKIGADWLPSEAGSSWGFHETWRNQTCANYAAFLTPEGYYLSTGGKSPVSTPSLPGLARAL